MSNFMRDRFSDAKFEGALVLFDSFAFIPPLNYDGMRFAIFGAGLLLLMGCASQPYHVTAIDESTQTLTSTCFYSRNLNCQVYEHSGKTNEVTQVCHRLGWGKRAIRKGEPRVIENSWGIGGRIEQDFYCSTLIAVGS